MSLCCDERAQEAGNRRVNIVEQGFLLLGKVYRTAAIIEYICIKNCHLIILPSTHQSVRSNNELEVEVHI